MRLLLIAMAIFAFAQANPLLYRSPLSLELNKNLEISNVGPQSISISGVMTGPRFDVNLVSGPNILEFSTLLSISLRASTESVVLNSYLKDLSQCFDVNDCTLGEQLPTVLAGDFPITLGEPFDLSIVTDSTFLHVFIDGRFAHSFRHRILIRHASHLLIDGSVGVLNVQLHNLLGQSLNTEPPTKNPDRDSEESNVTPHEY